MVKPNPHTAVCPTEIKIRLMKTQFIRNLHECVLIVLHLWIQSRICDNPLHLNRGRCSYAFRSVHSGEYFFNMSYLDKLFAYTAMRKQQEIEAQKIEFEAQLAGVKLVRR